MDQHVQTTDELESQVTEWAARLRAVLVPLVRHLRRDALEVLTPTELSVIGSIHRHGPMKLGEVASREHLSPPTITQVVAELVKRGLVERSTDKVDRRVSWVQTTEAGERLIDESRAQRNAWLAARLTRLTARERQKLVAALPSLERLLDGITETDR